MRWNKPQRAIKHSLWAVLYLCSALSPCAAQFAVEVEVDAVIEQEVGVDFEVMVVEDVEMHEGITFDFFEDFLFQGMDEEELRTQWQTQLETRLGDLRREAELTAEQFRKLDLAGRCDIKRLFEQVAACRALLPLASKETVEFQRVGEQLLSLQRAIAGPPFEEGSLFDKAAQTVLRTEQMAHYLRLLRQIQSDRRQTQLAELLSIMVDDYNLTAEQRDRMQKLLAESPPIVPSTYGEQGAWLAAAQLPAERYRAILDEEQSQMLQTQFEDVKQYEAELRHGVFEIFHAMNQEGGMEEEEELFNEDDPLPEDG